MESYNLSELLEELWQDYIEANPPAKSIYDLFVNQGEKVVNDHVAFRTFDDPKINVDVMGKVFVDLGYQPIGEYHFEKKKLFARHFEHADPQMPLIFVSQLKVQEFDDQTQSIIRKLIDQIPANFTDDQTFVYAGAPWKIGYVDYQKLKKVSEYAAWMSAYGFRVNHFTVSINHLKNFDSIYEVNQFLKDNGFEMNASGGEVKGTPADLLEQSSTIAYNKEISFEDGNHVIPACYYEFAKRYEGADGKLFRGFIAGSADKIFESTDKGQDF